MTTHMLIFADWLKDKIYVKKDHYSASRLSLLRVGMTALMKVFSSKCWTALLASRWNLNHSMPHTSSIAPKKRSLNQKPICPLDMSSDVD